jgi:hypothetical protein
VVVRWAPGLSVRWAREWHGSEDSSGMPARPSRTDDSRAGRQARLQAEQARTTASLAHTYLADTQERLADTQEQVAAARTASCAHGRAVKLHEEARRSSGG